MNSKFSVVLAFFILILIAGCTINGPQLTATSTQLPSALALISTETPTLPPLSVQPTDLVPKSSSAVPTRAPDVLSPTSESPTLIPTAALPSTPTPANTIEAPTATATPASPTASSAAEATTPTSTPAASTASSAGAASTSSSQSQAATASCEDKAAFYADVTIPDGTVFRQGDAFTKTWQIKNAGTCTWGPNYALVFAGGSIMNGPQTLPLPTVNPGDLFNISVNLNAPANGGTYVGDWQFQRPDGSRFGVNSGGIDDIWVKIVVSYVVVGPTSTPNPNAASCTGLPDQASIDQVLALINGARTSNGLKPLALNPKLSAAAQVHSKDMACNDFVDHTGSDGSTWFTRVQAQGYKYSYASENIYVGNPAFGGDPQGAFTWWMNSQVHRDNILSPKVTEIGIGYAFYDKSTYGGYYTVDFAHP